MFYKGNTSMKSLRTTLALCAIALTAVGCGDSATTPAQDASTTTDVVTATDVVSVVDAGNRADVVTATDVPVVPTDVPSMTDAGATADAASPADVPATVDAGTPSPTPVVTPASAMGHDRLFGVTYGPDGRIYAAGTQADSTDATADFRTIVARFNPDGTLDRTWGTMGYASANIVAGTNGEVARGVVVQSTGKVVVSATVESAGAADMRDRDIALVRFNADGSRDMSFGTNGSVILNLSTGVAVTTGSTTTFLADGAWGLVEYPDNRLVVTGLQVRQGGMDTDFTVIRLSADGARDTAFGTNGVFSLDINNRSADIRNATILADGSIVSAGYYTESGVIRPVLFKLTAAGQRDASFGTNGVYEEQVLAAATETYAARLQGTSFVTAGYGRSNAMESLDWLSLRISANGQRDLTYGNMGVARLDRMGFNDNARDLAVLPDNRVMIIGGGRSSATNSDAMVAVFTANGAVDTSWGEMGRRAFDFGGGSDFFWAIALSPDRSRVAIVGNRAFASGETGNDDGVIWVLPAR
jgi:uncharacterized delta-60 repeat protein